MYRTFWKLHPAGAFTGVPLCGILLQNLCAFPSCISSRKPHDLTAKLPSTVADSPVRASHLVPHLAARGASILPALLQDEGCAGGCREPHP